MTRGSAGPEPATGRTVSGSQARRSCGRSWDRAWESRSGARGWAPAPCAMASCPMPAQAGSRHSRRAIATSISAFATWREQFDALGARSEGTGSETFRRRRCAPGRCGCRDDRPTVGALNCQAALEVLAEEGFAVSASDLGGIRGRSIHFHTGTGEVLVHRLRPRPRFNGVFRKAGRAVMTRANQDSRSDRGRFRGGSPDAERCSVDGPGDRGHRHGQRSLRRRRTDAANRCRT